MYLKKLELKNYRNYHHLDLDFNKNAILLVGNNGQGKTNLLESIYYLSAGRSHRTYSQDELINWDSDFTVIRAGIGSEEDKKQEQLIEIELRKNSNLKIRLNEVYQKKKSDFTSLLPSVIFSPDDLKIVKSIPSQRRGFLDLVLEKIDKSYYLARLQYQKILAQRNSLIKSLNESAGTGNNQTLELWDDNLVKYGIGLINKRCRLLDEFEDKFREYFSNFFKGVNVDLMYIFSWNRTLNSEKNIYNLQMPARDFKPYKNSSFTENELRGIFTSKIKEALRKDLLYRTTTIGPHRDDFAILINGKDIRPFGSQGQQRIASISLKLCELHILQEKLGTDPILLLDDVLSELDIERRKKLVEAINDKFQTFVTATNISYIDKLDIDFGGKYLVKNNKINSLSY